MTNWQDRAACRGADTERFYPHRSDTHTDALQLCQPCTVRLDCLRHAIEHDERHGIWGGATESERKRIKRATA